MTTQEMTYATAQAKIDETAASLSNGNPDLDKCLTATEETAPAFKVVFRKLDEFDQKAKEIFAKISGMRVVSIMIEPLLKDAEFMENLPPAVNDSLRYLEGKYKLDLSPSDVSFAAICKELEETGNLISNTRDIDAISNALDQSAEMFMNAFGKIKGAMAINASLQKSDTLLSNLEPLLSRRASSFARFEEDNDTFKEKQAINEILSYLN